MKRIATVVLTVILLAITLYYVPVIEARELACDAPAVANAEYCP